jgi:hypothetical protein
VLSAGDDAASTGAGAAPRAADGYQRVEKVLVLVLFFALFWSLTLPEFGPDFWWHLAFGRWTWEHQAFLQADPFDFTSVSFGPSTQLRYPLTQYWLAQALLYGAFLLAGLKGAALLHAAVFTALFSLLYHLLRRTGAGLLPAALLLALAVQTIVHELGSIENRPQMWSSLFFVVLLLLLEHLREGKLWAQVALPPFMVLWANLHGGYILGVVVIVIAAAAAQLSRHVERKRILLVAVAAIALTGCNPAGFETLITYPRLRVSGSASFPTGIVEEDPLFTFLRVADLPGAMPGLTACFLLPLLTLWPRLKSLRRLRWDLLLIFLLTLGMGIKAQRHLVFMVPMACWVIALNVAAYRERLVQAGRRPFPLRVPPGAVRALTAVVLLALAASYARAAVRTSQLKSSAGFHHPAEGAADYLVRNGVRGNVFNEYGMGGYLAWRLHPALKIFIYGRTGYPELLALYNDVMLKPEKSVSLTDSGRLAVFYQQVLDRNGVDAVVIPAGDGHSGDVIPLAVKLAQNDTWAVVYAQPAALVFLRKTPAQASLVGNALPKSAVYDAMIAGARHVAASGAGQSVPIWRRTIAYATYLKGQRADALRLFDEYLRQAPGDTGAIQTRNTIARELGGHFPP